MTQRTPDQVLADAERASARLTVATRELLRWEWDSRFSAALSVVKSPHNLPVLEVVGGVFPEGWNHQSVATAPDPVRGLVSAWGGLMSGQRLFTLDPEEDPLLFAAWWPWGGGTTFSLRISCAARSQAAEDLDPLAQLRRWFSL